VGEVTNRVSVVLVPVLVLENVFKPDDDDDDEEEADSKWFRRVEPVVLLTRAEFH